MPEVPPSNHFYNEINPYRAAILRARIAEGRLPKGTVDERSISDIPDEDFVGFDQVHLFAGIGGFPLGLALAGIPQSGVRIVTGGFPCQDISNAGKRAGISGARSGLWREMARCIRVVRPQVAFVENVAALLHRGMGKVLGDLARIGYDARWVRVSAADCGAWHLRERIWIMAYPFGAERWTRPAGRNHTHGKDARWKKASSRFTASLESEPAHTAMLRREEIGGNESHRDVSRVQAAANTHGRGFETDNGLFWPESDPISGGEAYAHSESDDFGTGRSAAKQENERRRGRSRHCDWWAAEPAVDRMVYGVPARVDRLAALGDAIVPQACAEAIRRLLA